MIGDIFGTVPRGRDKLLIVLTSSRDDPAVARGLRALLDGKGEAACDVLFVHDPVDEVRRADGSMARTALLDLGRRMRARMAGYASAAALGVGRAGGEALLLHMILHFRRLFAIEPRFMDEAGRSLLPWDLGLMPHLAFPSYAPGRYVIDSFEEPASFSQLAALRERVVPLMVGGPFAMQPGDRLAEAIAAAALEARDLADDPVAAERLSRLDRDMAGALDFARETRHWLAATANSWGVRMALP